MLLFVVVVIGTGLNFVRAQIWPFIFCIREGNLDQAHPCKNYDESKVESKVETKIESKVESKLETKIESKVESEVESTLKFHIN